MPIEGTLCHQRGRALAFLAFSEIALSSDFPFASPSRSTSKRGALYFRPTVDLLVQDVRARKAESRRELGRHVLQQLIDLSLRRNVQRAVTTPYR